MPSATIEGNGKSPGELERALNKIVAGLLAWARANVVPVIKAERDAYLSRRTGDALRLADDVGANARAIIEGLRREAEQLAASAQNAASAAIQKEAQRNTRQFIAGVQAQAQIDVTALLRDDDLVDLLSIRSEEFNRLIVNLAQDIHDRIERETLGAIFEGRGNEQIAKSLQEIDGIGRNRSRLIARDQASKLNNAMNQFRQEQAGVTHYRWKTILDGRERPSHHANNDKIFAWSSPPANTGHPGHDINCFPGSTRVTLANGCYKLWRRDYVGTLVAIEASNGARLEATPNHPILTGRGWLAIKDVQEGDDIFYRALDRGLVDELNANELKPTFRDLFEAAVRAKGSHTAAMAAPDFHGDGSEGYVNVVVANGLLPSGVNAGCNQSVKQFALAGAGIDDPITGLDCFGPLDAGRDEVAFGQGLDLGVSGRCEGFALAGAHAVGANEHGGASPSRPNAVFAEYARDNIPCDAVGAGESLTAFAPHIPGRDLVFGQGVVAVGAPSATVDFGVEVGVPSAESLAQIAIAATKDGRSFFECGPFKYVALCVVKKSVSEFASHVYNLETSSGWYEANHIIAHNCRCRALAIITDDPEEIENSATPPDGGEMADFFTANLPAIRSVASVPRTNLGTLSTQDIAEKLAHSIDLQRKLASAGSAFTEKNAEQLVTELYGFLPKDADLETIAGKVRAIFSTRRSVLMAASSERLKLIERALVQARVTNSAAVPSVATGQPTVTPSVPSVAKTYPKGRYFEREVGKAIGADAAEAIAGTFTRLQGRATGHEWAVLHDAEGRIFARMSSGRKTFVEFRAGQVPEMYARGNKVTLHHNHPGSTSFSAEDLKFLNYASGLDKMWVHAHDGSSYAARVLNPTGLNLAIDRAQRETIIQLKSAVRAGLMAQKEGEALVAHVRSLVLAETGRIAYEYQLDGKTRKLVDRYQATIDVIVSHIAGTI